VTSIDEKKDYCVAALPVIEETAFRLASDIGFNAAHTEKYFNLRLSEKGVAVLTLLAKSLSDKLVFVVEGRAVGFFRKGIISGSILSITGKADSNDITWVFEKLKKRSVN
jgi:hypothetical protein